MPEVFQLKIPSQTWFALEVEAKEESSFAITGHTVTPGFDMNDFELANRQALTFQYPDLAAFIKKLTLENKSSCSLSSQDRVKLLE